MNSLIVTGGAGFIGSCLVRHLLKSEGLTIVNIDKLTYAGNLESLASVENLPRYRFEKCDICDREGLDAIFSDLKPRGVIHLAAESHVDRSIDGPAAFLQTNIVGTYTLLESARRYWSELNQQSRADFRFLHVSTDEVYGSLGSSGLFTENTPYAPNSPYSATKAASDFLVRAWHHTYGFPTIITNCSNNYGPYQFPEKLIPVIILNALKGKPIPVYGKGENVRDWLFVEDHAAALEKAFNTGRVGETYNIGGSNERKNVEVVTTICGLLDRLVPRTDGKSYSTQITYVQDRPGHDLRYAIDSTKAQRELKWRPQETFESGLEKTVRWYLNNLDWCERVMANKYRLERLGISADKSLPASPSN